MGRKLDYKSKLSVLLISYSFFITMIVLVFGFIIIQKVDKPANTGEYFVPYTANEINDGITSEKPAMTIEIRSKAVKASEVKGNYNQALIEKTLLIMVSVVIVVMILSLILSKFISKRLIAPIENMTSALPNIINTNNEISLDNKIFTGELSGVKNALENSTNKIKLLLNEANNINSYITHEQKNTLSILRAKIQIGERDELISIVDKMSSSLDDILAINATEDLSNGEDVDLALVCAEAIDLYSKNYKDLELEIDEEEFTIIKGRKLWIYRAICNLIENAIKYGNDSKIKVKVYNANNSSIICVEDGGKGIDKNIIDNIFNHKYRGQNLKKDGNGIGLSLVSHITSLCGGIAFAESEENKGSKIYMVFKTLTID
ncbi:MAG: HAMP domain-containing sensor histidine kinase [Clostridium sp.]|uniref:sensor histidine kinase n=1 Tax=Clostridium sp. TaxID=1506 RepID=UPI002FCC536C